MLNSSIDDFGVVHLSGYFTGNIDIVGHVGGVRNNSIVQINSSDSSGTFPDNMSWGILITINPVEGNGIIIQKLLSDVNTATRMYVENSWGEWRVTNTF